MQGDPAFAGMGSVSTWAYFDLVGLPFVTHHYVALAPRRAEDRPGRATIVFLHGGAGNFACYWYALSPLAREHGHMLVVPSFGFGDWHARGGMEAIGRVRSHAVDRLGADPSRLYLVALSNAGRGAMRLVARHPGLFRGVVLVSALVDDDPATDTAWTGLRVLVMHGAEDRRAPSRHARRNAAALDRAGARGEQVIVPGEDHFLLFSKRAMLLEKIARWVRASR
jgi:pimeloyl-ACP methyl ester carboxylesterase